MAAADIALADDIVVELNSESRSWAGEFTAERTWVIEWDTKETVDLQVAVNPSPDPQIEPGERGGQMVEIWPMLIGFAKDLKDNTREEIDALVNLVDDVREFLQWANFTVDDGRVYSGLGSEFVLRFDPDQLHRELVETIVKYTGTFFCVFRVNYRLEE